MRILQVIPSLSKGGAERMVVNTSHALMKLGHEVRIALLNSEISFDVSSLNIEIIPTKLHLSLWKKNQVDVSALQDVVTRFKPDVVHSHFFEAEINLSFIHFPRSCKRVVHFHDNMSQFHKFKCSHVLVKQHWTNLYERQFVLRNLKQYNSTFISISDHGESYINELRSRFANHIKLYNAIDLEVFQKSNDVSKDYSLIMVGSMVEKKNQKLAVETLHELHKRGQRLNLLLLGDGIQKQDLEENCKTLCLDEFVKFEGIVDNPEVFLNSSFIYLHTATYEPFGLVFIEAMACGLPVICTNGGGNANLINEGENGFMVSSFSSSELADRIEELLKDKNLYENMSQKAIDFAQQFGMETYTKKLLEIYSS